MLYKIGNTLGTEAWQMDSLRQWGAVQYVGTPDIISPPSWPLRLRNTQNTTKLMQNRLENRYLCYPDVWGGWSPRSSRLGGRSFESILVSRIEITCVLYGIIQRWSIYQNSWFRLMERFRFRDTAGIQRGAHEWIVQWGVFNRKHIWDITEMTPPFSANLAKTRGRESRGGIRPPSSDLWGGTKSPTCVWRGGG